VSGANIYPWDERWNISAVSLHYPAPLRWRALYTAFLVIGAGGGGSVLQGPLSRFYWRPSTSGATYIRMSTIACRSALSHLPR